MKSCILHPASRILGPWLLAIFYWLCAEPARAQAPRVPLTIDITSGDINKGFDVPTGKTVTFDSGSILNPKSGTLQLSGSTSGTSTLNAAAVAGTTTFTLPGTSGTVATLTSTGTMTGKVIDTSDNTININGGTNQLSTATGTGNVVVMATSPTLVTPTLGVATATSVNKVALTAPAASATLTLANTSTLATVGAFSTTLTATGTTNLTLPTTGTLATTGGTEVFTNKTFSTVSNTFGIAGNNAGATQTAFLNAAGIIAAYKAADTARVTTTSYVDDSELILALGTGVWEIKARGVFSNESASPGSRAKLAFSGTQSFSAGIMMYGAAAGISQTPTPNGGGAGDNYLTDPAAAIAGQNASIGFEGTIKVTVAGNLSYQWGQSSSHADDTILKKGSYIRAIKIGE